MMKLDGLFVEPEVLHEQQSVEGEATQTTRLCRSRLEPGCYLIRQSTRWGDGSTSEHQVYFGPESLADMAEAMRRATVRGS